MTEEKKIIVEVLDDVVKVNGSLTFTQPSTVEEAVNRFGWEFCLELLKKQLLAEIRKFAKRAEKNESERRRLLAPVGFDNRLASGGKPTELENFKARLKKLTPSERRQLAEELELLREG